MATLLYSAVCANCETHTGYSHCPVEEGYICSPCLTGKRPMVVPQVEAPPARQPEAPRKRLVSDFVPRGRTGFFLYAVVLSEHPDKVKIGMTRKWHNRRTSYANWNLASGNGVQSERVFRISEEYVDLRGLEAAVLSTFNAKRVSGMEWFASDIETAAKHIGRVLSDHGVSYAVG